MADPTILHGDSREVIKTLADDSVDSCVCDPPYGLLFMGRKWDAADNIAFNPAFWAEVLRVLKPGAHLLAFGGTRTFHRLACAIEDAGFEIRDSVMWHYGSGFPKSHDVSKGIDRAAGAGREIVGEYAVTREFKGRDYVGDDSHATTVNITAPATPAAREWQGWGTALKPATEIICLARKPLSERTVAANVLRHGTGAINVDGCRVGVDGGMGLIKEQKPVLQSNGGWGTRKFIADDTVRGKFPANLIHDGSAEVLAGFPETHSAGATRAEPGGGTYDGSSGIGFAKNGRGIGVGLKGFRIGDDSGSAARFFYTSKADSDDRLGSKHPTVKPVDLMAYLCRLVTRPGGTVLDPFAGSGTTGMACMREGFDCILIEREAEYVADIKRRLAHVRGEDTPLFAEPQEVML